MNTIRIYGTEPYRVAVVHGGPGARGSLGYMAERLSEHFGILEFLQTKYSIDELIDELHAQIQEQAELPVTLIGHSWGAWLSMFFAVRYPKEVKRLILIGTPPFENKYIPMLTKRRAEHLSPSEATRLRELLLSGNSDSINEIAKLVYKSDNYSPLPTSITNKYSLPTDGKMNQLVWSEAIALRDSGKLKEIIQQITCSMQFIHGEADPHPVEGVMGPLNEWGIKYTIHILPRCGHSPFLEREAGAEFFQLIICML